MFFYNILSPETIFACWSRLFMSIALSYTRVYTIDDNIGYIWHDTCIYWWEPFSQFVKKNPIYLWHQKRKIFNQWVISILFKSSLWCVNYDRIVRDHTWVLRSNGTIRLCCLWGGKKNWKQSFLKMKIEFLQVLKMFFQFITK